MTVKVRLKHVEHSHNVLIACPLLPGLMKAAAVRTCVLVSAAASGVSIVLAFSTPVWHTHGQTNARYRMHRTWASPLHIVRLPPRRNSFATLLARNGHSLTRTSTRNHTHGLIISRNNTNRCMYCCEQTVCGSAANGVGWWTPAKSVPPQALLYFSSSSISQSQTLTFLCLQFWFLWFLLIISLHSQSVYSPCKLSHIFYHCPCHRINFPLQRHSASWVIIDLWHSIVTSTFLSCLYMTVTENGSQGWIFWKRSVTTTLRWLCLFLYKRTSKMMHFHLKHCCVNGA